MNGNAILKYLFLGMLAVIVSAPARAQTVELSCSMSPSDQQKMAMMGYPENGQQVMHLSVDQKADTVTVWETYPGSTNDDKTNYPAAFSGTTAAWTIGDIQDGPQAHDSFDSSTNVLTTVDPNGEATQWNCSPI